MGAKQQDINSVLQQVLHPEVKSVAKTGGAPRSPVDPLLSGCPESHSGFRGVINSVLNCTVSTYSENVNNSHLQSIDCISGCKKSRRLMGMLSFCNGFTYSNISFAIKTSFNDHFRPSAACYR